MNDGTIKFSSSVYCWSVWLIGDTGRDNELLRFHKLIPCRCSNVDIPSLGTFEAGDLQHFGLEVDPPQNIRLLGICLEEFMHCFARHMLAFLYAKPIIQDKVRKIGTTPKVVGMEARVQILLSPYTTNSFVLGLSDQR